jgi:secreted trypsin-like serine protease
LYNSTAAHCVNNADVKSLKIRAGEWDIQSVAEPHPYTEHYVSSIIIHEAFNRVNLQNDVALLKLKGNVGLAQHINTICLPHQDQDYDGKRCFVSG